MKPYRCNNRPLLLFFLLLWMSLDAVHAQAPGGRVTGVVQEEGGASVRGATISLLKARDSSLVKLSVSDSGGRFVIVGISPGSYLFSASFVGHITYFSKPFEITGGDSLSVPPIQIKRSVAGMQGVVVTSKKRMIEQDLDKMTVNLDAFITTAGNNALEVLQRLPGITIDRDDNISLNGKQGVLVLIDGRQTYLTGAGLANLLRSINESQLSQVEIMTNPSSKYEAAGNAGIINIKTKKNLDRGFNGSVTAGYSQGKYPRTNDNINLNYRDTRLNLFFSSAVNVAKSYSILTFDRHLLDSATQLERQSYNQRSDNIIWLTPHNLKFGMDYFLSKKATIGFSVAQFNFNYRNHDNIYGYFSDPAGKVDSFANTYSTNEDKWRNRLVNLNYHGQIDSTSDITANVDLVQYTASNTENLANTNFYPSGVLTSLDSLRGDLPSDIHIYSAKLDYTKKFRKGLDLESGWKSSYVNVDNSSNYTTPDPMGEWEPDYGRSNHFVYRENINAFYINLRKRVGKWNMQVGVRYENTNYKGHQLGNPVVQDSSFSNHYNDLFPTVFVDHTINRDNKIGFNYGRRIDRPAYQDLNPFLFYLSKYSYNQGNPFLRPQYTDNLGLTYVFKGALSVNLSYSYTNNYFTSVIRSQQIISIASTYNLGRVENTGLSVGFHRSLHPWWFTSINATVNYRQVNGSAYGQAVRTDAFNAQVNTNNQFTLNKVWAAELSGHYNFKQIDGQQVTFPIGSVSAGVSRQLFGNKVVLKANVSDIFFTEKNSGDTYYQNIIEHFHQQFQSQVVNLSLQYRFGKTGNQRKVNHEDAIQDEKGRVKL